MTRYFSKDHEWVEVDGETATIGITDHAQEQLGDVVFVELPAIGTALKKGATAATVESVKAASEVYAPISGEVVEGNAALTEQPGLINEDAEGKAWFFKLRLTAAAELDDLMDRDAYQAFLDSLT